MNIFTWEKKDNCLPQHYSEMMDKIDADLQKAGITLHLTTLERVVDSAYGFMAEKSGKSLHYEKMEAYIRSAPMTYLPALLKAMIETCLKKRVFLAGGLHKFVDSVLKDKSES